MTTHPASTSGSPVGTIREGVVYELFFTALPVGAFTAADVVDVYRHRGALETAPSDQEQDPDRWCSQTLCRQESWQILSQWVWTLRLEQGHQLHPTPLRTTKFAPENPPILPSYGPPRWYEQHGWAACLEAIFLPKRMGPCDVLLDIPSICRNDGLNGRACCRSCLQPELVIVVPVHCT